MIGQGSNSPRERDARALAGARVAASRAGARVLLPALILLIAALTLGVRGVLRYTVFYAHSRARPESLSSPRPTCFYLDWRREWAGARQLEQGVSADGIARSRRDRVVAGRVRHNPLRVIQSALAVHDLLLDHPTAEREAFFRRQLSWLLGEGAVLLADSVPVWPHYDRFPRYGLEPPWISALTQGQAISLLVRAAMRTGDERCAVWARRAARALIVSGTAGAASAGATPSAAELPLVWRGTQGEIFLEEFPCEPPAHALNGCLLAWLGLWDYARFSGDEDVRGFCERSLPEISTFARRHEWGDWTRYDLHQRRPTSPAYHELHAALAEVLAEMTGDSVWQDRARRWRESSRDPLARARVCAAVLAAKLRDALSSAAPRPAGRRPPLP